MGLRVLLPCTSGHKQGRIRSGAESQNYYLWREWDGEVKCCTGYKMVQNVTKWEEGILINTPSQNVTQGLKATMGLNVTI
jgi:hypothetical protein